MSQHTTEYLVREITQYLKHCPEAANELLAAVAEGMTQFRLGVQQERQGQMQNTVAMLYSFVNKKNFTRTDMACILPSLFIYFRKGSINGHSEKDVRILQCYLNGVVEHFGMSEKDFNWYKEWVRDCHGDDMAEWFDLLIANAIDNGMFPNIFNTVGVTTNEEV